MNEPGDGLNKLDEISAALAKMPVPEGPDEEVKQRLLASLAEANVRVSEPQSLTLRKGQTMRRIASIAAVLLIVLGTLTYISSLNRVSPGAAFAAMLESIEQLRTVRFTMEIKMAEGAKLTGKSVVLAPNLMHQTLKSEMLDYVQITDFQKAQMLILFQKQKKAQLLEFAEMPAEQRQKNYLEEFREMKDEDAVFLGEESLDGVATLKYQYDKLGDHATIWLDAETKLPIQIVSTDAANKETPDASLTMRDFEWNVEVEEAMFSLEVPEGYALEGQEADIAGTPIEDFITTLRFYTRVNDDQFPAEYSSMMFLALPKMLKKEGVSKEEMVRHAQEKLAYALDRPDVVGMSMADRLTLGMQLQKTFGNGVMFFESTKQSHHWHFQGQGIKLGDAEKIVAWWYPKAEKAEVATDLATAHVLYGDLRVETMAVKDLPEVEKEPELEKE